LSVTRLFATSKLPAASIVAGRVVEFGIAGPQ